MQKRRYKGIGKEDAKEEHKSSSPALNYVNKSHSFLYKEERKRVWLRGLTKPQTETEVNLPKQREG